MDEIKGKYEKFVIDNLNKENFNTIVKFLLTEKCDFVEDIVTDYLDLFNIPSDEFINTYNKLNKKYDGRFLELVSEDMNYLEEFYNV